MGLIFADLHLRYCQQHGGDDGLGGWGEELDGTGEGEGVQERGTGRHRLNLEQMMSAHAPHTARWVAAEANPSNKLLMSRSSGLVASLAGWSQPSCGKDSCPGSPVISNQSQ